MSPDALTGPGRALQGLGRAISGLAGAFEAMNEPSDTDKLTAQLALLDASNNAEKYYTERLSSFTPETDPDAWHQDTRAGINSIFTDAERRVPGYPKLVDQYRVRSHAFVGDYDVKAHKYATGVKTERYATSAFNSLRSSLESADPTTPEGIALIDTIDKQLVRIPGLNVEQARSQIADDMVKRFEAEAAADPIAAMEKVEAIKKWREQLQIAPQPQQGQGVGPQSSNEGFTGSGLRVPTNVSANMRPAQISMAIAQSNPGTIPAVTNQTERSFSAAGYGDRVTGVITVNGRSYEFVNGGRGRGSIPLGNYDIQRYTSGSQRAREGFKYRKDAFMLSDVAGDAPATKGKRERQGLLIHDGNSGVTAGCVGIKGDFEQFKRDMFAEMEKNGGKLRLSLGTPQYYTGQGTKVANLGGGGTAATSSSLFKGKPKETVEAVQQVASRIGADPTAIGAVFTVESGRDWNPRMRTGSYRGVSQVGPQTLREMGVSIAQYESMSQAEQAAFYGRWLEHYKFDEKMKASGIDFASLQPARQAAILQAFQFAPNGDWVNRLASGDTKTPVTNTKQARVLGSTSIADMERYFARNGVSTVASSAPSGAPIPSRAVVAGQLPPENSEAYKALWLKHGGNQEKMLAEVGGGRVQVADASGRIGAPSGGQIAERVASRVDDNNRPTNTIPGQQTAQAKGLSPQEFEQQQKDAQARATPGEVRQERPQWASPSIRTHMLDKFNERAPMLAKAAQTQLRAYVERVEKSAGDGYLLPDQERALIHERMNRYGSDELKVRLKAAEQAAAATAQMKQLPPTVLSGQIAQLRSAMNQAGATPEIIAKAKAAEALHTKMVKELNENAIGWGAEAGVIGPQMPITPQTFSVDALRQRAEAANVVAQHYGLEYRQFFSKEEKEALEAQFSTGGDNMLAMMGMMYEAFGDDLPRAVAEISPKYPEAARAGYLLSTGGDPKAAEAIAQSIERRQDPNYKGNIKLERDANEIAKDVFGDYFRDMPQRERDATMRAAEAIYIANFRPDMDMDSEETFKSALKSAMGERTNAAGEVYGGVVNTKGGGAFFPSNKEAILLPSNVRQKTWRQLFDFISVNDMVESGHPIPVDANGTPLRMPKVLGGRMVQVGDGKYMFEMTNRDGSPAWVMEGQPQGAAKSDAAAPLRPSKPFVLDLKTLTPVLRRRWPDFFWKE